MIARADAAVARAVEGVAEGYTASAGTRILTLLKGGPVGGVLDMAFSAIAADVQSRRTSALIEELQRRLGEIEARITDPERLASSTFFDTIRVALEAALRTEEREKIRAYARLVAADAAQEIRGSADARMYIEALLELSPLEIEIARGLLSAAGGTGIDLIENLGDEERRALFARTQAMKAELRHRVGPNLAFHLARLRRVGFIIEASGWDGAAAPYPTSTLEEVFAILGDITFVSAETGAPGCAPAP
jgi:hypothetical protein